MKWKKIEATGDIPTGLFAHSATAVGSKIYVIGGKDSDDGYKQDLLIFDTKTKIWTKPVTHGTCPDKLTGHTATLVDHRIYVIGSREQDMLSILDTQTLTWSTPEIKGTPPSPRFIHTANLIGNMIYVFGGYHCEDNQSFNDMYTLDTDTLTWTHINALGTLPVPRSFHVSVLTCNMTKIVILGGFEATNCHQFDITTNTWSNVRIGPMVGKISFLLSLSVVGKRIVVFDNHCNNTTPRTLKFGKSNKWKIVSSKGTPPGTHCHSCCTIDNKIYMIGGKKPDDQNSNEIHIFK